MIENRNALARYDSRTPTARSGLLPVRGGSGAPIHQPGELHWTGSASTREQCWDRLSPAVRERVNQRMGDLVEWWATDHEGQVTAAVLGTRALIGLEPTINANGKAATKLNVVHIDESSFRSVRVNEASARVAADSQFRIQTDPSRPTEAVPGHLPGPGVRPSPVSGSRPGTPPSPGAALAQSMDENMSNFLGMLPTRAQQLVQDPFLHVPQQLRYDLFAYRTGTGRGLGGATLQVWCYLTDQGTVTFCAGRGHGYREHGGVASWELTCWRASTTARPRSSDR